tara:strand:+ start:398 stop:814 length:417 start_codon:yes stop_codon:yes gene_type:complete
MKPSQVLNSIGDQIALASVTSKGAHDKLRRVKSPKDAIGKDRHFFVSITQAPIQSEFLATNWRTMTVGIAIIYNDSPAVYDRAADDSEAIAERLETLSSNVDAIQETVMLGFAVDDASLAGQLIAEFQVQVTYSKDIS